MKTVGEVLKARRIKQKKTLLQIYQKTKIPEKTLKALENNNFVSLPPATFVKGFIKVYAENLGLEPKKILAIFRRDWQREKKEQVMPQGFARPLNEGGFNWTPKATWALIISTFTILFLIYIGFQLKEFFRPPKLVIKNPSINQNTKEKIIEIIGQTDKDVSVYVNNQLVEINEDGKFSYQFKLFSGENKIEIKAVDRRGKETVVSRKVIVDKKP